MYIFAEKFNLILFLGVIPLLFINLLNFMHVALSSKVGAWGMWPCLPGSFSLIGSSLKCDNIDWWKSLIFVDVHTIDQLKTICAEHSRGDTTYSNDLEAMFFTPSATQALYNIEVSECKCVSWMVYKFIFYCVWKCEIHVYFIWLNFIRLHIVYSCQQ